MTSERALAVVSIFGIALISLTGCGEVSKNVEPAPNCGWDTSVAGGQRALNDYLTETDAWLKSSPTQTPPAPSSSYWMGDCPNSGTNIAPPIDEAGDSPH